MRSLQGIHAAKPECWNMDTSRQAAAGQHLPAVCLSWPEGNTPGRPKLLLCLTTSSCDNCGSLLISEAVCRPLKHFLVTLVIGTVAQKQGLHLDKRYKLPKMRYKGDQPLKQLIRQPAPTLISEVCSWALSVNAFNGQLSSTLSGALSLASMGSPCVSLPSRLSMCSAQPA